ncbi:MAG: SAM-dependent methyltransferase [Planctomycetota bacterium]|jgi:23S rRNA (cytidine1920-2'-O)/16S rRNA (cytidine1409-2'-O)-methyltransferase
MSGSDECVYVSRGGLKLAHALEQFGVDVAGMRCADLGCSTGGFTDCLLRAGAQHVTSVDTAYNVLDYSLRRDERVRARERENAMHAEPGDDGDCDLVVVDIGWTPQRLAVPAAMRWLREGGKSGVITLIKPHYEAAREEFEEHAVRGVLPEDLAQRICDRVIVELREMGYAIEGVARSPITGGKGKRDGNTEWLALVRRS